MMTCTLPRPARTSRIATGALAIGAVAFLLTRPTVAQQARTPGVYTLATVTNGLQLKTPDGRVVFEYLTQKPADSGLTSPSTACFHPLNTPSGERLTALAPDDHPHHRGMYLAWHDAEFRQPIGPPKSPTSRCSAGTSPRPTSGAGACMRRATAG